MVEPNMATRLSQDLSAVLKTAGEVQAATGECSVGSLSSFTCRLPVADLRRAAEYRFLLQALFGVPEVAQPVGIMRVQSADAQAPLAGQGVDPAGVRLDHAIGLTAEGDPAAAVFAFLKGVGLQNRHALLGVLADAVRAGAWQEESVKACGPMLPDLRQVFRWSLQEKLTYLLNGQGEDPLRSRSGKLAYSLDFLAALDQTLEDGDRLIRRDAGRFTDRAVAVALSSAIREWRAVTEHAQDEVRAWVTWLIGAEETAPAEISTRPLRRQPREANQAPTTLYGQLRQGWLAARNVLAQARQVRMRSPLLDDQLEQPFSDRLMGLMPPAEGAGQVAPLARARCSASAGGGTPSAMICACWFCPWRMMDRPAPSSSRPWAAISRVRSPSDYWRWLGLFRKRFWMRS